MISRKFEMMKLQSESVEFSYFVLKVAYEVLLSIWPLEKYQIAH